ncbi:MAG: YgiQ family radical SAM protein [Candidatus Omnitrophica bacterium]|nr:YgiQ family radical SAM protein [Candidatus Omnitrophota bacterium]MCM8790238.1 YgiQ family radical SAM protein [Candidatus Omnitrophota bacterium]
MNKKFLPISKSDMEERGWDELDIILVTGDAYVDHPSYGAAVIGRVLEDAGFKVGIIAQPRSANLDDFKKLGRPRLFFGVSAGNLDSMVANYTANKKVRNRDEYSPGGKPRLRPDRATLIYANRIREAFANTVIVIGGMEASLRRLAHYDYWSDTVRRSLLLDSKADILVYGMGETAVLEIARRLKEGKGAKSLEGIRGTVIAKNSTDGINDYVIIPSFEEVRVNKDKFNEAFRMAYLEQDPFRGRAIIQPHEKRLIIQFPPVMPLSEDRMDHIYGLPYTRLPHPSYKKEGGVPGFESVKFSIVSHRGCPGECSFCSLFAHQGRIVQSRSRASILKEIRNLAGREDFRGTITDIGGPTANLYGSYCHRWKGEGACKHKKCLAPERCKNLIPAYDQTLRLWQESSTIPGVKNVFVGSGVRYDLLVEKDSDEFLKTLCEYHVSGLLKVAPEHSEEHVLKLMNKPPMKLYDRFVARFNEFSRRAGKKQFLVNYFIAAHPGSTLEDALRLALALKARNIRPEQIQDFIPLPMTLAAAMYHTEKDPFTGKAVYVAKGMRERKLQRALMQFSQPQNKKYVIEALRKLRKTHLIGKLFR